MNHRQLATILGIATVCLGAGALKLPAGASGKASLLGIELTVARPDVLAVLLLLAALYATVDFGIRSITDEASPSKKRRRVLNKLIPGSIAHFSGPIELEEFQRDFKEIFPFGHATFIIDKLRQEHRNDDGSLINTWMTIGSLQISRTAWFSVIVVEALYLSPLLLNIAGAGLWIHQVWRVA